MAVKNSLKNSSEAIGGQIDKDYMMSFMRKVCSEAGYRITGTEGEKIGAELFKKEYEKYADEVVEEKFICSPDAYPAGGIKPVGWFFVFSVVLFFLFPILSWIVLIPMAFWILELFFLKRVMDPFFPKKESMNIIAKLNPNGESKTIMVFAGHHDSPLIFSLTAKYRKNAQTASMVTFVLAIVFVLMSIVRGILSVVNGNVFIPINADGWIWIDYFGIYGIIIIPLVIYISQNFVSHNKCLGANDNLSGAISALSIAKYFKDPNKRPKNVEIWCVAFGAEEAGQRGSTDFVMKHKDELIGKDAYFINFESVGGGDMLVLATGEKMCVPPIKHSKEVYDLVKQASQCDDLDLKRECHRVVMDQGYTDAEPFSRYGIKATSITGLNNDGFPMVWHIITDTPDIIQPDCMVDAIQLGIKSVQLRDKQF